MKMISSTCTCDAVQYVNGATAEAQMQGIAVGFCGFGSPFIQVVEHIDSSQLLLGMQGLLACSLVTAGHHQKEILQRVPVLRRTRLSSGFAVRTGGCQSY